MRKIFCALFTLALMAALTTKASAQSYYIPLLPGAGWSLSQSYPTDYLVTGGEVILLFNNYPASINQTTTPYDYFDKIIQDVGAKGVVQVVFYSITGSHYDSSQQEMLHGWVRFRVPPTKATISFGSLITFKP